MMTTPKRYEPDLQYGGYGDAPAPMMSEHPDGDYVHHDDYRQLTAKLAEVTDEYCAAEKVIIDLIEARDELAAKLAEAEAERDAAIERRDKGWKACDEARQQLAELREAATVVSRTLRHWVERSGSADYAALADKLSIALTPAQLEPEITEQDWKKRRAIRKAAAGALNSVGEPEPDPGEGWGLCDMNEGEQFRWQWDSDRLWYDGKNSGATYHRRRKVMPPTVKVEGLIWYVRNNGRGIDWGHGRRLNWGVVAAWCHRLDGETEAPKILTDWERE